MSTKNSGGSILDLTLNFPEAEELITSAIQGQFPIMLHGKPGIGKSDLIRAIAKKLNRKFIDIRLPLYESVDLKGYPYLKDLENGSKSLSFALTEEFPWEDTDPDSDAIILLDEINGAMQSTMLASYQLILDRAIGNKKLAKGVSLVAAGNRESDKGATNPMPKPLENRFLHVEIEPSFDAWAEWAIADGVDVSILGYLAKNQHRLNDFNPQSSSRAFGTPRSWAKASKLLLLNPNANNNALQNLVASAVGVTTALEFMTFRKIAHEIPDSMDILKGKAPKLKNASVDISYMLITNVLYRLRELHEKNKQEKGLKEYELTDELASYTNNFFKYLLDNEEKMGQDIIVIPIGIAVKNFHIPLNQVKMPAIKEMMVKSKNLLNATWKA